MVLTVNLVALSIFRRDNFVHPTAAMLVVAGLVGWTVLVLWIYSDASRRVAAVVIADLAVAMASLLVTPWLKGDEFHASVGGFWVAGALLVWAVHWWLAGGVVAGVLLSAVDLSIRDQITQTNYGHVFLLVIAGAVVGHMCASLQRLAAERDHAEREAARESERTRLARAVHDGVLQVLALVQRRAGELGGEAAELGRLAGEQESALRSMIRQQDTLAAVPGTGPVDLVSALEAVATRQPPRAELSGPGAPVLLPARSVEELVASVRAALDNVADHVGADASAWVLVEDLGDEVVVSVRDEGPGIADGRLEEAADGGRLGVSESIRGRLRDLGGTAELRTGPAGTEWELTVPR